MATLRRWRERSRSSVRVSGWRLPRAIASLEARGEPRSPAMNSPAREQKRGSLRMPTAKRGHAGIDIAAPPERVFGLITDVTRMGEWSPECYRCVWLDGATSAYVGARFRGYNKLGRYQWATTADIAALGESRLFVFTVVHDKTGRD